MSLPEVTGALDALDGVRDVHHVHAWALTSGRFVFSGHIRVGDAVEPQEILSAAHEMLREQFGFFFVTLQVETVCMDEKGTEAIDLARSTKEVR